ncbi:MAG: L-seryl-tRNA(Sec) selenium transferase [Anaerolineales bacterium]|nr:L-seryl-tRNA(Sec) selenium transferase [Anaerolineales bacterium]
MPDLRNLPSVDKLLNTPQAGDFIRSYGRPLTLDAMRWVLEAVRKRAFQGQELADTALILAEVEQTLALWTRPTLVPVINASGVIIHTNLGRAPLSRAAVEAMEAVARGYSNLEYDLEKGCRGSRLVHAEELLVRLTGAEAALVVNNNAAAVFLALTCLAKRRRVLIARTQLVEIGGGFRIPDVMAQSGAKLVEIGTTNRVHLWDYQQAIEEQPIKLVMRAHRSNFAIVGFHTEPGLGEVAGVAHGAGIPLVEDLGSGTLIDTRPFGLEHEPTIQESLAAGADLVTFSGDKLLGGPQAGVIVGRADLVAKLKRHPLARAIRADKLALAALSATLTHYLKEEALREIPVWRMIATPSDELKARASGWQAALGAGEVLPGESTVGGGSLPGQILPTFLLALPVSSLEGFLAELRAGDSPIVARIQDQRVVLDPRTVSPEEDGLLITALAKNLHKTQQEI